MARFDTLSASGRLREVGVEEKQVDAVVGLLAEDVSGNIATKSDIELLRTDMKSEFELLRAELRAFEQRMTIRLGGLIVVATGIIIAVLALTA